MDINSRRVVRLLLSHRTVCQCFLLWIFFFGQVKANYIKESFTDFTNKGHFSKLVVHQSTGKVAVSAVNRLYLLTETLGLEQQETTGPKEDVVVNCLSPSDEHCHCQGSDCDKPIRPSVTKALLIDYDSSKLLVCFNLYHGHCEKRSLVDLSLAEEPKWVPMVPNDEISPVVMYIAPGPGSDPVTHQQPNVLYIAATRSLGESIYKDMVPTICSRNLSTYHLVHDDTFTSTRVEMDILQKMTFRIYYIYGFSSGGFSYFLTVQFKSVSETNVFISRIVRVCQNDTQFYSYTEVPLKCTHNNTEYKIIQGAYLGYAGKELATSLGLPDLEQLRTKEHVLYTIFSNKKPDGSESTAAEGSAMCVFTLRDIRRMFTRNIQECFQGIGNTGPAHISRPDPCREWNDVEEVLDDDYCGKNDFNHPISGSKPVEAEAVILFPNESVTAIAVAETHDYTVAFLGTDKGYVKKIAVESRDGAFEYEYVQIQDGSPVNSDMAFDRSKSHVYAMTEKKVARVKVQDCQRYANCSSCLAARDPYCGWCSLDNRCTKKKKVPTATLR